ncbi:unnamed protein product [Euphydryas editha]|uniref:Uncharacterized protein n=1 Tax=Euphydryas editha TaxID=104508 RepID=A0AAU9UX68_EUPED|nr:unnamed protein product [Euphydryas editha]
MPRKRKFNISQSSNKARGMKIARRNETSQQADLRRLEQTRTAETLEQSLNRRQQQTTYKASQRVTETFEAAESRKRAVAERAAQRRQTFTRNTWRVFSKAALEYDQTLDYETHKLIKIEAIIIDCRYCGCLKWKEEAAGLCCSGGKVTIPSIDDPVEPLRELFSSEIVEYSRFLRSIRKYNTCFHTTSFGVDKIVLMPGFCPTFTIQG